MDHAKGLLLEVRVVLEGAVLRVSREGALVLEELQLLEDESQLLHGADDGVLELGHVEVAPHVLVLVVSEHVQLGLDLLLALEHGYLAVPVVEVVEIRRPVCLRSSG